MKRAAQAAAIALLAQQAALAEEVLPVAMATVDIVGVAPGAGMGIERRLLPYTVQALGPEQLQRARGDRLADAMARNLNGVNVNEISGSPFQNDVTYRGFRASPVLGTSQGISVYLDGVRINEPFGDVINWDMLPESAIGKLQLVPGSNPVYGLNTLGGALALDTRSGSSDPGLEAELSLSGRGQRRADLAHGANTPDGWHSFIGATLFDDDGWRDHSEGKLANAFVKLGRDGQQLDWSASLLAGRGRLRGNGLLPDAMYRANRLASYTFPDETRNQLQQLTLRATWRSGAGAVLSAQAYARSSRRDTINGDAEADDDGPEGEFNTTGTRQRSQGASLQLSRRGVLHRLDLGATFDRSRVSYAQFEQDGILTDERGVIADPDSEREPASSVVGKSRAFGMYATDTWTIAAGTHLTAAARYNHARVDNTLTSERGVQPAESFSYRKLNPALGIAREAGNGWTLVANAAQGNRVPTVIELGCADPEQPCQLPVGLQADPYLKQVVARTLEAGARYQQQASQLAFSVYRTVNRDDILFLSSGLSRQGYFSNFERTVHQGVDLNVSGRRGPWSLRAAYSYLDASYDADGVLFTGLRTVSIKRGAAIAGLPRHTLKLGADWRIDSSAEVGADLQATSSLPTQGNEDGLAADPVDGEAPVRADLRVHGHVLLNLRASWEPGERWQFYARLNNATNRRYETFGAVARDLFSSQGAAGQNTRFVAPGAPRTLVFGVRYRFQ